MLHPKAAEMVQQTKTYIIISLDAETVFDKFEHPFMMIDFERSDIQGTYLTITKSIYSKLPANIKLNRATRKEKLCLCDGVYMSS